MDYMADAKNPQDDIVSLIEPDRRDVEKRLNAVADAAGSSPGPLVPGLFDRVREAARHV